MQMDMSSVVWSGRDPGLRHRHRLCADGGADVRDACRPRMRNEGTALFNLMRNIGSSIGISAVQALFVRNTQVVHASLAQHITSRIDDASRLGRSAEEPPGVAALNQAVTAQAAMIAYLDDFHLMLLLTLLCVAAAAAGAHVRAQHRLEPRMSQLE